MAMTLEEAAQVMREAMRETVKRHSLWYLVQSALMILAGIVALVYPVMSSVAMVIFIGWLLIISGLVGILLAFYLWANIPLTAAWLIGILLGIELICEGVALGSLALQARKS